MFDSLHTLHFSFFPISPLYLVFSQILLFLLLLHISLSSHHHGSCPHYTMNSTSIQYVGTHDDIPQQPHQFPQKLPKAFQQQQQQQQQQPQQDQHQEHEGRHLRKVPQGHKTNSITWFVAIFCTLLWVLIILGGLIILIVYLVFRPHSPHFDIQSVGLNAAYLDTGILLNSDVTLLANFTNPNRKVNVDFSYIIISLYYGKTLIATTSIDSFPESNTKSKLFDVHMVSSEVCIPVNDIVQLRRQIQENKIVFEVKGLFRSRSNFGSFLRYSYWLHGQCTLVLTAPPSGVLVQRRCRTKH